MAKLADLLIAAHVDVSGSRASNRFKYQRSWTICRIIDLHFGSQDDYAVLCDYHEDVFVISPVSSPTAAWSYQIKTDKTGRWSRKRLTGQKKGKSGPLRSILGKMFAQRGHFKSKLKECCFVSNARYTLELADGTKGLEQDKITGTDLSKTERSGIAQAPKKELNLKRAPTIDGSLVFEVSSIPLDDQDDFVVGRLAKALDAAYPDRKFAVPSMHRVLSDGITKSSTKEGVFKTLDGLVKAKGVIRSTVQALLNRAGAVDDLDTLWLVVQTELGSNGCPLQRRNLIRTAWRQYEIERMDPTNGAVQELGALARPACADASKKHTDLLSILGEAASEIQAHKSARAFAKEYVEAVVLVELYEGKNSVQPTYTKSPEEDS